MIISSLDEIVVEKKFISYKRSEKTWHVIPYETDKISGKMLVATEMSFPKNVTLRLNVKGLYKIYLGFINCGTKGDNHTAIKLTADDSPTLFCPDNINGIKVGGYNYWAPYHFIEEGYWKTSKLDGQDIVLEKPKIISQGCTSNLCFIRLEPTTESEIEVQKVLPANKNMMYHFDTDHSFWYYDFNKVSEWSTILNRFENSTGEIVVQETYFEDFEPVGDTNVSAKLSRKNYQKSFKKYLKNKDEIEKFYVSRAHELGLNIYAGTRMEMGNFMMPLDTDILAKKFVIDHPEYAIYTRDGRKTNILSYAYPEVRKFEIDRLMKSVERGYDGVSLFFIRGVFVGFEQPVKDLFNKRYPDLNIEELPLADDRLNGCESYFITLFIKELKQRLVDYATEKGVRIPKINAIVNYGVTCSKIVGCDIKEWLDLKLVDSISQGLMSSYEDLDGCYYDDKEGLIDISKYKEVLKNRAIFKRLYHDNAETVLNGAKELLSLTKSYEIDFYGALPWEGKPMSYFVELAQELYSIGVKKLISWNANHIAEYLPKLNLVKGLGDKEKTLNLKRDSDLYRSLYRVMSLDGIDISTYNPSWLG